MIPSKRNFVSGETQELLTVNIFVGYSDICGDCLSLLHLYMIVYGGVQCTQGGVYYAVPSSVPGVQHIVYSVPVDSAAELLQGISDQPSTVIHVCSAVYV